MENNLIDCTSCENWSINDRMNHLCENCNNSRFIINPKYILCNMCEGPLCKLDSNEEYQYSIPGLKNIQVKGGFHSYHLLDMNVYTFSLCEKCLRELFVQFKIKPLVNEAGYAGYDDNVWKEDQSIYEYREWKNSGGFKAAYINGKCNFVKECPNNAIYTQFISNTFTEKCCCEDHKNLFNYMNSTLVKFIPNTLKPFL